VELSDRTAAGIEDRSLEALRQAGGEAFDRAFLSRQLALYRPMAELFQNMASNSPDPALQRLGITVLASVRSHFETARKLGEPMGLRVETVENPPQY
jgi:predicted outer membrane protein